MIREKLFFFFRIDISYCIFFFMLETRLCSYKTWNIITIIKIKTFVSTFLNNVRFYSLAIILHKLVISKSFFSIVHTNIKTDEITERIEGVKLFIYSHDEFIVGLVSFNGHNLFPKVIPCSSVQGSARTRKRNGVSGWRDHVKRCEDKSRTWSVNVYLFMI